MSEVSMFTFAPHFPTSQTSLFCQHHHPVHAPAMCGHPKVVGFGRLTFACWLPNLASPTHHSSVSIIIVCMFPDHDKVRVQEYIYYYPSIYPSFTSPTYGWSSKRWVWKGWFLYVHFPNLTLPQDIPPYGIIIVCMFPAVFIIHEDRIIPFYGHLGCWVEGVRHELVSGGPVRRVRFWGSNFWGWSDRSDRDPTFGGPTFRMQLL